jgi:predicted 3-demethylubiquinone-9 3-methyltransferase (glyoxalase superfamily)
MRWSCRSGDGLAVSYKTAATRFGYDEGVRETDYLKEKPPMTNKITPFLWFNDNAEEAVNFYTSIFKNSKILSTSRYGEGAPMPAGTLMSVTFELEGQQFMALNGGPQYQFTEAISLYVDCKSQAEVDDLWSKLTADGGEEGPCGWLKDKFGLSWQIIPSVLGELLGDPNPARSQNVLQAMFQMKKLDIAKLQQARDQA